MTKPESIGGSTFKPIGLSEAAMIFGGAAAEDTYEKETTTLNDGSQKQDWLKVDTVNPQ